MTTKTIITVGDPTDHGGTVISGSPLHTIRGRLIARVGDQVLCPLLHPGGKPHGINKIISGSEIVTIDGIPVAVEGSKTECGCTLLGTLPAKAG